MIRYQYQPEDLKPQSAVFNGEEEFWQNPVRPIPLSNLPFDPRERDAHPRFQSAVFHGEEDYWQNRVTPLALCNIRFEPAQPDEIWVTPPVTFHPEEDYWQNAVRPLLMGNGPRYAFGDSVDDDSILSPPPANAHVDYVITFGRRRGR